MADKFNEDNLNSCNDTHSNKHASSSTFKFELVTPDFVFDQICKLSNNKSTGTDNISMKFWS